MTIRDPSNLRLVIFDLDNTLCDHHRSLQIRLDHAFLEAIPDPVMRKSAVAESVEAATDGTDHFEALLESYSREGADSAPRARERYRSDRFRGLELYDDVLDGIEAVRSSYTIAMITNGPTDIQQPKLDLLNIEQLFSFVLISERTGFWKPDPRIFELALERAGIPAHESVYVGDSVAHDVPGAHSAGLGAVWMNRRGLVWTGDRPPDHEARNMNDLLDWLNSAE